MSRSSFLEVRRHPYAVVRGVADVLALGGSTVRVFVQYEYRTRIVIYTNKGTVP